MTTENVIIKFNIGLLIRKSALDLRSVALKNSALRAEGYFEKLEHLIEKLPEFVKMLDGIKTGEKFNNFERESAVVSKLLDDVGYPDAEKLFTELDFEPTRAEAAPQLLEALTKLYSDISPAYSEKCRYSEDFYNELFKKTEPRDLPLSKLLIEYDRAEQNRKPLVLAVDDVSVVLSAITSALENEFEVCCLTKAEQVERFMEQKAPDLFLLDIEMPGMNGFDLVKMIRQRNEHKDTPIMFLTGNATVKNFQMAMALGIADFIAKPVAADLLVAKVNEKIIRKKVF